MNISKKRNPQTQEKYVVSLSRHTHWPLTRVSTEIAKRISECGKKSEAMGVSRSDEKSQRAHLGKLAANFERIVGYALNAYYTEDHIFNDRLKMRLITRIIKLNEIFSKVFSQRGHTRHFEHSHEHEDHNKQPQSQIGFNIPNDAADDLDDIIRPERFQCPEPSVSYRR
jgi:hypothetical protein